jgi:hypothetical protein
MQRCGAAKVLRLQDFGRTPELNRGIGNAEVEGMGMLPPIVIVNQIDTRGYHGSGRE